MFLRTKKREEVTIMVDPDCSWCDYGCKNSCGGGCLGSCTSCLGSCNAACRYCMGTIGMTIS